MQTTTSETPCFTPPSIPGLSPDDRPVWGDSDLTSTLQEMLTYRRPHGSESEREFIDRFLIPLGVASDDFGNLWLDVKYPCGRTSDIVWSSHTDTVHHTSGRQEVSVAQGYMALTPGQPRMECLGADDGAGVFLMVQMIHSGVPGLYIFHRDEECGGTGSKFIKHNLKHLLEGRKYAIAFDRKGLDHIITYQAGGRCASDAFAKSLASQLGLGWKANEGGLYTDTAEYTGIIPECTNLSVGYESNHCARESLDYYHLLDLLEVLLDLDETKLVCEREPVEDEPWWEAYDIHSRYSRPFSSFPTSAYKAPSVAPTVPPKRIDDTFHTIMEEYPDVVIGVLKGYGVTEELLLAEVYDRYGINAIEAHVTTYDDLDDDDYVDPRVF